VQLAFASVRAIVRNTKGEPMMLEILATLLSVDIFNL